MTLGSDDSKLLERVRGGERDAYRILVERYQKRVYNLAYSLLKSRSNTGAALLLGLIVEDSQYLGELAPSGQGPCSRADRVPLWLAAVGHVAAGGARVASVAVLA